MRILSILLACALGASAAPAEVNVLTTTTDLAALVRIVGGDQVDVSSLCRGPEDPHFLDARPSFLRLVHRADLVVANGMELEVGYLPLLLRNGSNARVRRGEPGYLDASARIHKLQVPAGNTASRALGDVHPLGNPHYLFDPANAVIVADEIAKRLSALRPAATAGFAKRAKAFRAAIRDLLLGKKGDGAKPGLLERFRPYKGTKVITYHEDAIYLAHRLGLEIAGSLEPKPGVPPTARHLAKLKEQARAQKVRVVLYRVYQPKGPVEAFCRAIGAKPVLLAHQPGAFDGTADLVAMYRHNAEVLLKALGEEAES